DLALSVLDEAVRNAEPAHVRLKRFLFKQLEHRVAETADQAPLFERDDKLFSGGQLQDRRFVERFGEARVQDRGVDAVLLQIQRRLHRGIDEASEGDEKNVFPGLQNFRSSISNRRRHDVL